MTLALALSVSVQDRVLSHGDGDRQDQKATTPPHALLTARPPSRFASDDPRRLPAMREPPHRIERLPEQYFTALLARVAAAAAEEGEPLVDLGRGNPEATATFIKSCRRLKATSRFTRPCRPPSLSPRQARRHRRAR